MGQNWVRRGQVLVAQTDKDERPCHASIFSRLNALSCIGGTVLIMKEETKAQRLHLLETTGMDGVRQN